LLVKFQSEALHGGAVHMARDRVAQTTMESLGCYCFSEQITTNLRVPRSSLDFSKVTAFGVSVQPCRLKRLVDFGGGIQIFRYRSPLLPKKNQ
jgi:hypothetical protein